MHVPVALAAEAVAVQRLVGQREHVERGVEVADRVMQVDRLDGVATDEVDGVEHLASRNRSWKPARSPGRRTPSRSTMFGGLPTEPNASPVATDRECVCRVPGVQRERRRRMSDQLGRPARGRSGRGRRPVDLGAGGREQVTRLRIEEVHADLVEDAQRRVMDRLELVGRHDLGRSVDHARLGERALHGQA